MNRTLLKWVLSCLLLALPLTAAAWDKHMHETIACLASKNLAPKTKKQVERILGGSMADHATWLNTQKRAIDGSKEWHNILIDESNRPVKNGEEGLSKIAEYEKVLRNRKGHPSEEVAAALKGLIHIVSDMHNPSHVLFSDIPRSTGFRFATTNNRTDAFAQRGTTTWRKFWNDNYSTNKRSFSVEWFEESAERARRSFMPHGSVFEEQPKSRQEELIEMCDNQIVRAGRRLAHILNTIFAASAK